MAPRCATFPWNAMSAAWSRPRCPRAGRWPRWRRRRSPAAPTRSPPTPAAPASTSTPTPARRSTGAAAAETPQTNAAIAATAGQIVTYAGNPAITYFFASSGGHTEASSTPSRLEPEPWLRGVADPYDQGPQHSWKESMSFATAARGCAASSRAPSAGSRSSSAAYSPRILLAYVLGSGGDTQVTGADWPVRLGLASTWAYFSVRTARTSSAEPDRSGHAKRRQARRLPRDAPAELRPRPPSAGAQAPAGRAASDRRRAARPRGRRPERGGQVAARRLREGRVAEPRRLGVGLRPFRDALLPASTTPTLSSTDARPAADRRRPWLLYRSFFALPKSIADGDGAAGERAAGDRQRAAVLIEARPARGRSWRAWEPSRPPTGSRCIRPTTPTATRCRRSSPRSGRRRRSCSRASAALRDDRRPRGRRPDVLLRPRRGGGGRAGAAADGRPRPVRGGHRARPVARAAQGRRAPGVGPARSANAMASSPSRCPTSSPCAATPPTGFPARRGSAPRPQPSCCAPRHARAAAEGRAARPGDSADAPPHRAAPCATTRRSCSPSRRSPRSSRSR